MTSTILRLSKTGLRVSYQEHGAGEPLVLLHGVGLQSSAWAPQIATLKERYRIIALDLPGHGGSDALPEGSHLPAFVLWCAHAIAALDLGAVNLAGHSMGAMIAGGVAVNHPEMVRRVALLNGVFCRDAESRAAVKARAAQIQAGSIDVETPLLRWFDDRPADAEPRTLVSDWLRAVDPAGYGTAYMAFAHGDATYADRFSQIACPFLALTGDGDANSTPAMAKAMCSRVLNGRTAIVEGHRHMVNLTAAGQVTAHLLDWLMLPTRAKEIQ